MEPEAASQETSELRQRVAEKLRGKSIDVQTLTNTDIRALVHELEVHQIELEIQNEELRRIQRDLEAALAKYQELFDFAPVAYFTIDPDGVILDANLTAATLLGLAKRLLNRQEDLFFDHQRGSGRFLPVSPENALPERFWDL